MRYWFFTWIVVAMAIGLGAGATPKYARADGASPIPEEIRRDRSKYPGYRNMPANALKRAYDTFNGASSDANPERAADELRLFVLSIDPDQVRKNLTHVRMRRWRSGFLNAFEQAIDWGARIRAMSGKEVYGLRKKYLEDEAQMFNDVYAGYFFLIAIRKKYGPARYEWARKQFDKQPPDMMFGRNILRDLGNDNYSPAVSDLVRGHIYGGLFPIHDRVAYYWIIRGEWIGLRFDEEKKRLEPRLNADDHRQIEKWLQPGEYPRRWDY